ncbi:signal peptidase I [Microbacter sp. GSS18]|nr:signal peptidase I [Microbacter sp. GSS18]
MTTTEASERPPLWRRIVSSTWFHFAAAIVLTGLVLSFVAKPFWVPSSSMADTLEPGDRVLVNRLAYVGAQPATGDVIVFDADETWGITGGTPADPVRAVLRWIGEISGFGPTGPHTLIKRVIAGPGQTVECCDADGSVVVDGEPLDETYLGSDFPFVPGELDCESDPASQRCLPEVTVADGSYVVLGDNRTNSADSARLCRAPGAGDDCWRFAPGDGVVGKAVVILWPIGRWSGL